MNQERIKISELSNFIDSKVNMNLLFLKLQPFLTSFNEAGCDEAGRGCLAGPVVSCCSYSS